MQHNMLKAKSKYKEKKVKAYSMYLMQGAAVGVNRAGGTGLVRPGSLQAPSGPIPHHKKRINVNTLLVNYLRYPWPPSHAVVSWAAIDFVYVESLQH